MSLSNKFKYDKVKKNINHIKNTESYINFFNVEDSSNSIQDITAIVGDNGNGKTTLLKLIADLLKINENNIQSEFIIIISENYTDFKIYTNINDLIIPENNDEIKLKYEAFIFGYHDNIFEIANKLKLVYYSNAFDNSATIDNGIEHENVFDISTMYLMKNDKLVSELDDSLMSHIQAEYIRQIEFVASYQNSERHLKFDIPKEIYIDTKGIDKKMEKLIDLVTPDVYYKDNHNMMEEEYFNRENLVDALESIKYKFDESIKNYVLDPQSYTKIRLVYLHLVISLYSYIKDLDFSRIDVSDIDRVIYFDQVLNKNNIINSCIKYEEEYGLFLDDLEIKSILNDIEKNSILSPLFLDYVNDTVIYDINKIMVILKETDSKLYKEVKKSKKTEIKYIKSKLFEFFEAVCLEGIYEGIIEIFWPLSTGQYNLLSLYSRLHELYDSMSENHKSDEHNIILLLDEGENSLHPRWQQQYVKSIIDLVDDIFDNANIQIILTTHSPILLSDIPGDNVIYINRNRENIKTFGSNIYNLYRQGFFLNGSNFGILGDFATEKLKKVGEILFKWENEISNIEELTINKNNILNEKEDKETQIKELEKKKNELFNEVREKSTDELEYCKKIINIIGEKFIRDTMLDQYNDICKRLEVKKENSNNVYEIKDQFDQLSIEEQNEFIKYIIEKRKK